MDSGAQCKHENTEPVVEDDVILGAVSYGYQCKDCGAFIGNGPGPLELGTYK